MSTLTRQLCLRDVFCVGLLDNACPMHDTDDSAISHITSEGALSRPTDRPTDDIKKTSPLIELLKKTSRLLGNKHEKKDRVLFRRDSLRNRSLKRSSKRW